MNNHIISNEVFSPQNFLELITGKCYVIGDNPKKQIETTVSMMYDNQIYHCNLDKLETLIKEHNNIKVVLVSINNEYYWYSIPEFSQFEYPDSTIINVYKNSDGEKMVKFLGYHYHYPDDELYEHRFEEYYGFEEKLSNVIKEGICEFEDKNAEFVKQSTLECSYPIIKEIYNENNPKVITKEKVDLNIPCGYYIIRRK